MSAEDPPKPAAHFDLDAVRKNWQRAVVPEPSVLAPRMADVRAPLDPFVAARADLETVKSLSGRAFPSHVETLNAFFDRLTSVLSRMETAADAPSKEGPDPAELRADLDGAIHDLEDLLEVYSGLGR